jgi:oxygen-independent coproporphyrinogen-3 oxidase
MSTKIHSLYIHYPHCLHLCNYCDFFKTSIQENSNSLFVGNLEAQIQQHKNFLESIDAEIGELQTLYIGGGTPALIGKDFDQFQRVLTKAYRFSSTIEFTLEVDPGLCTKEDLIVFRDSGVNRFSIGVQSIDPLIQPFLDRSHTVKEIYQLLENVSEIGLNCSVDFMLGLAHPKYLQRNIEKELEQILKFRPNHISLYILTVPKHYDFFDLLPTEDAIAAEYEKTFEVLRANGFEHYEVSNYALKTRESQHNWKYWKQESVAALGPSATGFVNLGDKAIRYKWGTNDQGPRVVEELNLHEMQIERTYTLSRTKLGILISEHTQNLKLLKQFSMQGFGVFQGDRFVFNTQGRLILDSLVEKLI